MNTKEAKDFLADQAAQQAALDRTPLSGLEWRMMYFTESNPDSCDDPVIPNDEFEENMIRRNTKRKWHDFSVVLTNA